MRTILYPGSFDPLTNGHFDVAVRAGKLFDRVIVAVAVNSEKSPMFTMDERMELIRQSFKDYPNIQIASFRGLLVNALKTFDACAVLRGLRAVSDFEYEFQMALMNRELNKDCETLFMMPSPEYSFLSSRLIKEIAVNHGDISAFVPPNIKEAILKKLGR